MDFNLEDIFDQISELMENGVEDGAYDNEEDDPALEPVVKIMVDEAFGLAIVWDDNLGGAPFMQFEAMLHDNSRFNNIEEAYRFITTNPMFRAWVSASFHVYVHDVAAYVTIVGESSRIIVNVKYDLFDSVYSITKAIVDVIGGVEDVVSGPLIMNGDSSSMSIVSTYYNRNGYDAYNNFKGFSFISTHTIKSIISMGMPTDLSDADIVEWIIGSVLPKEIEAYFNKNNIRLNSITAKMTHDYTIEVSKNRCVIEIMVISKIIGLENSRYNNITICDVDGNVALLAADKYDNPGDRAIAGEFLSRILSAISSTITPQKKEIHFFKPTYIGPPEGEVNAFLVSFKESIYNLPTYKNTDIETTITNVGESVLFGYKKFNIFSSTSDIQEIILQVPLRKIPKTSDINKDYPFLLSDNAEIIDFFFIANSELHAYCLITRRKKGYFG